MTGMVRMTATPLSLSSGRIVSAAGHPFPVWGGYTIHYIFNPGTGASSFRFFKKLIQRDMQRFIGRREAERELQDLGCGYQELTRKRKAGQLDGLFIEDHRTKRGDWLYDVEGIRKEVQSGRLWFGNRRPPMVVAKHNDLKLSVAISIDLAEKLLDRDHATEVILVHEVREAIRRAFTVIKKEDTL